MNMQTIIIFVPVEQVLKIFIQADLNKRFLIQHVFYVLVLLVLDVVADQVNQLR